MGTVIRSLGIPVARSRRGVIKVMVPPPPSVPTIMFARALRPRYDRLVAFASLLFVVAIYAFGAAVVCEVARADTQVQAASAEYRAAGVDHDR
jgi:hypothetical protein